MMATLKYKVISSESQYNRYCNILEELVFTYSKSKGIQDEIDLLTLLIEKYDQEKSPFSKLDPIELIKSFMSDHKIKNSDLAKLLNVSEGLVSDMLNKKKGLSKESIRILSEKFKISQEVLNQPYELIKSNPAKKTRTISSKKMVRYVTIASEPEKDYKRSAKKRTPKK